MEQTFLTLNVDLGKTFADDLRKGFNEELEIAAKKWQIKNLSQEEKDLVLHHSAGQLKQKCYDYGIVKTSPKGYVVKIPYDQNVTLTIPSPSASERPEYISFTRKGFVVENSELEDNFHVSRFARFLKDKIIFWGRTAVFYGVGSFSVKK